VCAWREKGNMKEYYTKAVGAIIHGEDNVKIWDSLNTGSAKGGKTETFNALLTALGKAFEEQGESAIWAKIKSNNLEIK
jgi:hypothetical protein